MMGKVKATIDSYLLNISIFYQIPEFDWNSQTKGLVLSSFFYGYLLTQLPGGWLAAKIGGNRFVPFFKTHVR